MEAECKSPMTSSVEETGDPSALVSGGPSGDGERGAFGASACKPQLSECSRNISGSTYQLFFTCMLRVSYHFKIPFKGPCLFFFEPNLNKAHSEVFFTHKFCHREAKSLPSLDATCMVWQIQRG